MGSHSIYGGLYNIYHSFISECYELEVEGISVLASLESEMERECTPRSLKTNFYEEEDDDDDFSEELLKLEKSERIIKEELPRIDVIKYETKKQNQKETIDNSCIQYNENFHIRIDGASNTTTSNFNSNAFRGSRSITQISSYNHTCTK